MNHFPVSSSILSAIGLNSFLREKYKLTDSSTCSLIKAGINHTYLVTDNSTKYVFRLYSFNWRTGHEIAEELRLIGHLHKNNIPVSYPVADGQGQFILELAAPEGKRMGVMFSYASGEKVINFSTDKQVAIGRIMAEIHRHTNNFKLDRIDYNTQTLLINSFERLASFIDRETEEMIFMLSAQKYLAVELNKVDEHFLRRGAVHLDIWFDNLNINKNNEITVFDFDFCGNGWLCLDIAYYLLQLYFLEPDEKEYRAKYNAFMEGYESVVEISDEEKRLLPLLGVSLYFFYLGVQSERFENWSNVFLNETYLKRYINLRVKKYFDFHKLGAMNADA
jgi:Ser/Thr protein kinase RdoA (MazF antagonist)